MSDELAWQSKSRFFYVGENKYPRMFIVHVWNIFSVVLFFLKRKKNHACLKTYIDFFLLVNHHTSPMNILGFFPIIPNLGFHRCLTRPQAGVYL